MHTGLLQALAARYATFYFTDTIIALNVLLRVDRSSASFFRANGKKPWTTVPAHVQPIGNAWWEGCARPRSATSPPANYLAKARPKDGDINSVRPDGGAGAGAAFGQSMTYLKLHKGLSANLQYIKRAFRRQAKEHHPDQGGDATCSANCATEQLIRSANACTRAGAFRTNGSCRRLRGPSPPQ